MDRPDGGEARLVQQLVGQVRQRGVLPRRLKGNVLESPQILIEIYFVDTDPPQQHLAGIDEVHDSAVVLPTLSLCQAKLIHARLRHPLLGRGEALAAVQRVHDRLEALLLHLLWLALQRDLGVHLLSRC